MISPIWPAERRRRIPGALVLAVVLAALPTACGGDDAGAAREAAGGTGGVGSIVITGAWIRPAPAESATTALYMTISNEGDELDVLTGAAIDGCAATELHATTIQDEVMTMVPLPDGITVTPDASVVLGPGAIHVMCLGVETGFAQGDTATAELEFREAGSFEITAEVRSSS